VVRAPHSILFFARITPSKKADLFIRALGILKEKGVSFTATICGDVSPKDAEYVVSLKKLVSQLGLDALVSFRPGVPNDKTPEVYSGYDIYVNASPSGMYDKMIFEAMDCGSLVVASSKDLAKEIDGKFIFTEGDEKDLADKLAKLLAMTPAEKADALRELSAATERHSLRGLGARLAKEMEMR